MANIDGFGGGPGSPGDYHAFKSTSDSKGSGGSGGGSGCGCLPILLAGFAGAFFMAENLDIESGILIIVIGIILSMAVLYTKL